MSMPTEPIDYEQLLRDMPNVELGLRRAYYYLGRIESLDVTDHEDVARKLRVVNQILKEAFGLLLVDAND